MSDEPVLDALDLALLTTLRQSPRAGILELSRTVKVARATVQSRLDRMERVGVITGYGPDIDIVVAGYPVQAFVTLEIAQGSLDKLHRDLSSIPGVLEAYATTGTGDVLCRVAAAPRGVEVTGAVRGAESPALRVGPPALGRHRFRTARAQGNLPDPREADYVRPPESDGNTQRDRDPEQQHLADHLFTPLARAARRHGHWARTGP
jgi:DNA-binding Lrp family transcriptional regulator